jgi:hypothetical protein
MLTGMTDSRAIIKEFLSASQSGQVLLLYYGMMNREVKEHLVAALKLNLSNAAVVPPRFKKRAYSIADECITNIFQYYASSQLPASLTGVSVYKKNNCLDFIFTNTVKAEDREKLEEQLKKVYKRPPEKVKQSFEDGIVAETDRSFDRAGLGLIIVSQRALGNFDFHFEPQRDNSFLFHLKISLDLLD